MNTFKQYFQLFLESKADAGVKLHLSHLEDLVIEGGKQGFADFVAQITNFKNYVYGLDSETVVNLKVDGAPALYFGADPRVHYKGQFFVASKSGFNKQPKINHTPEEIQKNHGNAPGLVQKLLQAYTALRPVYDSLGTDRIYQGDIIFTEELKKAEAIDGIDHITFQPQLIKYAVPVDEMSDLYNRVNVAKFGISIHDSFKGATDDGVNVRFKAPSKNNQDIVDAGKEHNVFIESSTYNQQQINLNIPRDTKVAINTLVAKAQNHIEQVSQEFDALYTSHGKFMGIVQRFINDEVKKADRNVRNVYSAAFAGDEFNEKIFTTRFGKFLSNNYDKEIQGKGERGIQNAQERLDNYKRIFEDINFQHFISATHYMIDIKKYVLDLFSQVEDTIQKTGGKIGKSFIPQADGTFTLSRGEGFVLFVGDNQVKIVDRLDFSAKNLTTGRFQK
tara:strand:- start:269 stop:1609 length:1341 start_codon:yes stop_codon:yes gene_type:complete